MPAKKKTSSERRNIFAYTNIYHNNNVLCKSSRLYKLWLTQPTRTTLQTEPARGPALLWHCFVLCTYIIHILEYPFKIVFGVLFHLNEISISLPMVLEKRNYFKIMLYISSIVHYYARVVCFCSRHFFVNWHYRFHRFSQNIVFIIHIIIIIHFKIYCLKTRDSRLIYSMNSI